MFELSAEPWKLISRVTKEYEATHVDILSGFIGAGAVAALASLGLKARILIGLPAKNPTLSRAQIDEIRNLNRSHEVRSLPGLHAKLYVFGDSHVDSAVVIGSANFTRPGFESLDELIVATDEGKILSQARKAFTERWNTAKPVEPDKILTADRSEMSSFSEPSFGLRRRRKSGFSGGFNERARSGSQASWDKKDAFGSHFGTRAHQINEYFRRSRAPVTARQLIHACPLCGTLASANQHIQWLRKHGYVEQVFGGWQLTVLGRRVQGLVRENQDPWGSHGSNHKVNEVLIRSEEYLNGPQIAKRAGLRPQQQRYAHLEDLRKRCLVDRDGKRGGWKVTENGRKLWNNGTHTSSRKSAPL